MRRTSSRFSNVVRSICSSSPPYADQRAYSRIHPDRYVEWFLPFARAMFDASAETGSLVLNIKRPPRSAPRGTSPRPKRETRRQRKATGPSDPRERLRIALL